MINLLTYKEELKRAENRLYEANLEGNYVAEENAIEDIENIYQAIGQAIMEELNESEQARINDILDEANSRIETQALFEEMRLGKTY